MQFRRQKNSIAILRYDGYKKDTKQPILSSVGSIDLVTFKFAASPGVKLDVVEKMEIDQTIEREQLIAAQSGAANAAMQALEGLRNLSPGFDLSKAVRNDPDAIWTGLLCVEKALKAAGFEKPKKSRGAQSIPDSKTGDLLNQ